MPLFGRLHDDIFLLFSGSNRQLYACVIGALYREFYSGSSFASPFRQDVLLHIAETVRGNAALWADEEVLAELPPPARRLGRHRIRRQAAGSRAGDPVGQRSNHVYARLLATGWLVEEPFGFNTQVEMPPAAMALAEQLVAIEAGLSQLFAGVVAEIRTAVRAILDGEERSLLALPRAAESAGGFVRRLRAIHASLRDVERSLMTSGDLEDRLRHFIDEFVDRVVIVDFRAVLTSDHPYHHRHEILRSVDELRHHEQRRQELARKYVQASIAPDEAEAWLAVEGHLSEIESTFASVDDFMGRLNAFRARLEERLRNTVRYMERADDSFSSEVADLIRRLDAIAERREAAGLPPADWPCALPRHDRPWAAELAAQPRAARAPVAPQRIAPVSRDPAEEVYRSLARRFARLFAPRSDAEVAAFLERCVPNGSAVEASAIRLECLEDFLLFDEVRRRRHAGPALLDGRFLVAEAPGLHSSAWIECPNFALRRGPGRGPAAASGEAP